MGGFFEASLFPGSASRLERARAANQPGSRTPHTVVVLPSYSVGDSLLAHYAHRIPALEHRQLLSLLALPRVPGSQVIFVTSLKPSRRVLDYYLSLVPPEDRRDMRARIRIVEVADATQRSVTAKLLDRPDLIAKIRRMVRDRLAYIDPWNVTPIETELARRLRLPLNGTAPELWPLGFKSSGRKIMRSAGVPVALGHEDVRSVDEVVAAAEDIRRRHPHAAGVVVKSENSGTGDGNRVIRFTPSTTTRDVRASVEALEPWYLEDVMLGCVVEELLSGTEVTTPSVQLDIAPDGGVELLSTHEQVVGGPHGQVYDGCRLPAYRSYGSDLARYGLDVGRALAERGALGRFSVDFVAVRTGSGGWEVFGLEINLRKTGTMHALSVLANLAPGRYDGATARWLTEDGAERCYRSTDNLVDPAWHGRSDEDVITAIRSAGLEFDPGTRTGVVLHMFSGLGIDGRLGLTAIGTSPGHAEQLYEAAAETLAVTARPAVPGVAVPV
jgi:hypothetical protein